ncbi:MAG: phosphoglycerate kinase [Gammaproteobacteria bacterium]
MNKLTLRDVNVRGRRVLVRVDFNVRLTDNDRILDDFRITQSLPTIRYLREHGARVILCSHLSRPEEASEPERFSMGVVAKRLTKLLEITVPVAPGCVGPEVERAVARLVDGDILLLENLRFDPGEAKNDREFAERLASLGEVYVSDAFATAHRKHASVFEVPKILGTAIAGFLVEEEIKHLEPLVVNPARPYGAIFGGAKISDKVDLIRHFLKIADVLVLGGAMANTFLKAQGFEVGKSRAEASETGTALQILAEAKEKGKRLLLPIDVVVAEGPNAADSAKQVDVADVGSDQLILDIGSRSVAAFAKELKRCKTIVWNGPVGRYEVPRFARGTRALARAIGKIPAYRVAGGGDTSALHRLSGVMDQFDWVSTGGGAFLEYLLTPNLPGLSVLTDRPHDATPTG